MKIKILYIHLDSSFYINRKGFIDEQEHTLLYKSELGKSTEVHYLLNNNLDLHEVYNYVTLKSVKKSEFIFILYCAGYILKHKFDFVIIHSIDNFIQAAFLKLLTKTKVFLQHHAEKTHLRKKAVLMRFTDTFIDGYFFNGKEMANSLIDRNYISGKNKVIEIVEGACDFKYKKRLVFNPVKEIVFIGRLNQNKNVLTLLKAISLLKEKRTDFRLSLYYSTAEQEEELRAYCLDNKLNTDVVFFGFIDRALLEDILNNSDIFVSCSLYEGSGYSLIESMACGCYPVTSNIEAFNFLLKGLEEKQQFNALDEYDLFVKLSDALDVAFNNVLRSTIRKHFESICSPSAIALKIKKELELFL